MPKVRLNYDGWLALSAAARRVLAVDTGDQLEVDAAAGSPTPDELPSEPAPAVAASSVVKRGPGRPRKTAVAAPPAASTVLPPHLKTRDAKRKAAPAGEPPR
jgi:hypothetical protein